MWSNLNTSVANTSGGFLNDSLESKGGNTKRVENVTPVMIRHLTQPCVDFQLWGTPIHLITFVGIVRDTEQTTTKVTYEIEDETGSIAAFHWLEAGKKPQADINVNTYVRIYGFKREQNGTSCVLILRIWPLTNLSELTNHLLEVTHVMLKAESMFNTEKEKAESSATNDVTMTDDNVNGLTREQTLVFKVIQEKNESDNGMERDELQSCVPASILPKLNDIIDFLISEGHIYTTFTDDHFKTTC